MMREIQKLFQDQFPFIPNRIKEKIEGLIEEEDQYAADELVELAEEILHQIAAVGVSYYLNSDRQKEVYNDFLLQLFNSSGHEYNAGPIFRWTANMIKDLEGEMPQEHFQFFWKEGELCSEVHHLAMLRNEVMHGFFVLPPERNLKEAKAMVTLLQRLNETAFFNGNHEYHFISAEGFSGHWNITDDAQWEALKGSHSFGQLCERIQQESTDEFWRKQDAVFQVVKVEIPLAIQDFVLKNGRGAMGIWFHPNDDSVDDWYTSIGTWLKQQKIDLVAYQLYDQGLSYTGGFLLNRLIQVLNENGGDIPRNRKSDEILKKIRKENNRKKVVVLVKQIDVAMFSPQHLTKLFNFLYENNILLLAIGSHYEHFNGYFNTSITMDYPKESPTYPAGIKALHNYLRFKGPSKERAEEREAVTSLEQILEKVSVELSNGQSLYARRFADEHGYDIEMVHEIFALLHPWVNTKREVFEADTVDELYGFPSTMTEVTPIYLALGRRDLKLEYQHKVISL